MRKQHTKQACTVCGRSRGTELKPYRGIAVLCALHDLVVRGLIPAPMTTAEVRSLFPARVREHAARAREHAARVREHAARAREHATRV